MKRGKRGALELSVSTIVIIVIGVTLLSLGLILVRGIMSKTQDLTSTAFANAEGEIGKLSGVDSLLTVAPDNVEINKGGAKDVEVIVANFEDRVITVSVKATSSEAENVKCVFKDKVPEGSTSDTYTINSGEQVKIKLVVDDKGSNVGLKHCVLEVVGDVSGDTKRTLLIRVTQKKGIFG